MKPTLLRSVFCLPAEQYKRKHLVANYGISKEGVQGMKRALFAALVVVLVTLGLALGTMVPASAESVPTVWTGQADYSPDMIVDIHLEGFQRDASLAVVVIRPDNSIVKGDGTFTPGWDVVQVGGDGTYLYDYKLDGILGLYKVKVFDAGSVPEISAILDGSAMPLASTTFTDAVGISGVFSSDSSGTAKTSFLSTDTVYAAVTTSLVFHKPLYNERACQEWLWRRLSTPTV